MVNKSAVETAVECEVVGVDPTGGELSVETKSDNSDEERKLSKEERKELAMARAKVDDDLLFKVGREGLLAEKVSWEIVDGQRVEKREADHNVRHKYFDSILRAKGYIRVETTIDNSVNFNLTVKERQEIRGRLAKVFGSKL